MKILIPILENKGDASEVSPHFGHCPFFALADSETKKIEVIENRLDHSNPNLTPVDQIMVHKPDLVYSLGIGQRAISLFKEKGVKVKTGPFNKVKDIIENTDRFEDLTEGCKH